MNLALQHRGSLSHSAPTRAPAERASKPAGRSRAADYVADVFLIALLAAPFLIFEVPGPVPETAIVARSTPPAVTAAAAPESRAPRSALAVPQEYGPE